MRTVFFTGSGLSADSGLPTFWGKDGYYEGMRAEELLTGARYRRDPIPIETFLEQMRAAARVAEPNAAHRGIAEYCARYPDTLVLTQNIDDLLERAGVPRVIHLHGSLFGVRCKGFAHRAEVEDRPVLEMRCKECNSRMRSDVVLFHEGAPEYRTMYRILGEQGARDHFVVIGTQGAVISIGEAARKMEGRKILNNLHPSQHIDASFFDVVLYEPAATAFPTLLSWLERWREES